jgi:hypothetical protein
MDYIKELKKLNNYITEEKEKKRKITEEEARKIGDKIGIDWNKVSIKEFTMGLSVELEHGKVNPKTNVTDDDLIMTGKIDLAHLEEFPDYYTRLKKMESEAEEYWKDKR